MRIKGEFVLREIAGDIILVPIGNTAMEINGMVTLDEVGAFIWKLLELGMNEEQIIDKILTVYEVDETAARMDLQEFLEKMMDEGLIMQ